MNLRQHQHEFNQAISGIIAGSGVKTILLNVCPGGGKSALPLIAGRLIIAGKADAIAWIVPRKSLQDQAERNFIDPFFRRLLGHNLTIRTSTNDINPCRGLSGFCTTYQAVGMDNRALIEDFSRKRYVFILDETHHVEAGGTWAAAFQPLVDMATYVVLMTGTMARGDRQPIAFIDYEFGETALWHDGIHYIEYTRTQALIEKAIIPLRFHLSDASVKWINKYGAEMEARSIARAIPQDMSAAIYTALRTNFARDLLNAALLDWHKYRSRTGHDSAFLVVTADVNHARQVLKYMKARGVNAEIATSHDSPRAQKAIRDYKSGKISVLVSVAMAYEGLDVPRITHIACLTQIRSEPWIVQMLARAVRVDQSLPYEGQEAFVFAPDDALFRNIVENIRAEQMEVGVKTRKGMEENRRKSTGEYSARTPDVIPVGSRLTGDRSIFLGHTQAPQVVAEKTPTEQEAEFRKEIETWVRKYASLSHVKIQVLNGRIKREMGKGRAEMTMPELKKALELVKDWFPLGRERRIVGRPPVVSSMPVQGRFWEMERIV